MVRIKLFSILAEKANKREFEVKIDDDIPFHKIIPEIFKKTNDDLKRYIFDEEHNYFKDFINIVINQEVIDRKLVNTKIIKNSDVIALLTPIEGG
jgi:molybdopterin converting factor small subunit